MRTCKKYFFIHALVLLVGVTTAQSYHKGSIILDLNTGIEIYNFNSSYHAVSVAGLPDTSISDQIGNSSQALGLEFGIGKYVGVGLRAKTSVFFDNLDRITNSRGDMNTRDLMVMVNLHPLVVKNFDLVLGAEAGLSQLRLDMNNPAGTTLEGKGGSVAIYVNPRLYLGRFGLNLKTYLPVIRYGKLRSEDSEAGTYILSALEGSGLGLSLGIQLRLF
jgi:hypothetical protein